MDETPAHGEMNSDDTRAPMEEHSNVEFTQPRRSYADRTRGPRVDHPQEEEGQVSHEEGEGQDRHDHNPQTLDI